MFIIKPKHTSPINTQPQEMAIEEDHQEVIGSTSNSKELTTQVMKGKRTKRQRPTSPLILGTNCTLSSGESLERVPISPSTSMELSESVTDIVGEEDRDMANCLIILAQGNQQATINNLYTKQSSGLEVYKCKTCNRCFPSFQALGGHRASHKKASTQHEEDQKGTKKRHVSVNAISNKQDYEHQTTSDTTLSLQMPNSVLKSMKVHECSICGAQFSSGQALGGHMRRHRPLPSPSKTLSLGTISSGPEGSEDLKRSRARLELDLNLPAQPEEGLERDSKFHFTSTKEKVIVFSASPLVDCHY